jgi:hypothetical protein
MRAIELGSPQGRYTPQELTLFDPLCIMLILKADIFIPLNRTVDTTQLPNDIAVRREVPDGVVMPGRDQVVALGILADGVEVLNRISSSGPGPINSIVWLTKKSHAEPCDTPVAPG